MREEQKDDIREKLKKAESNHIMFSLLVALGGLVLFCLVERFPNVEWWSIGMLWFLVVMAIGFILR